MTRITDERLAEMVGAGVPCVPAQPGEIAAMVQELRASRTSPVEPGEPERLSEDRRELLMVIENVARMAEQGVLSADGGQAATEIRSLVPLRFRAASIPAQTEKVNPDVEEAIRLLEINHHLVQPPGTAESVIGALRTVDAAYHAAHAEVARLSATQTEGVRVNNDSQSDGEGVE